MTVVPDSATALERLPDAPVLLTPDNDVAEPELSIVIPALNEAAHDRRLHRLVSRGPARRGCARRDPDRRFLDRRHGGAGTARAARASCACRSADSAAPIMDAMPFIRGQLGADGRRDCTYDFRRLSPFVEKFRTGARVRDGLALERLDRTRRHAASCTSTSARRSRPGSSTALREPLLRHPLRHARHHARRARADGPPIAVLGVRVRDGAQVRAHAPAHRRRCRLRFLKDREGRLSHHKRSGWFSPWHAAWINLRAMFVYGADFFVFKPGLCCSCSDCLLTFPLALGPITLGPVTLSLCTGCCSACRWRRRAAVHVHGRSPRCCSTTPAGRRDAGYGSSRTRARC